MQNQVIEADNLSALKTIPDASVQLIYIDPPFNTGRKQTRGASTTKRTESGRLGFKGFRYEVIRETVLSYDDEFADYWSFLEPRLEEAWRILNESGTLYLHLDYREAHYAKVVLDALFGRECFLNEIIWAYDYGGKSKSRWPAKHDTILVYVKNPDEYYFDSATVDREPYMAPGLVTPEKVARGKLPTDVWWHTIVSTTGREKTGYPTQKPLGILRRVIQASSREGDVVLDFFAGSGTTGAAAAELGRRFILIDQNPESIAVITKRMQAAGVAFELHQRNNRVGQGHQNRRDGHRHAEIGCARSADQLEQHGRQGRLVAKGEHRCRSVLTDGCDGGVADRRDHNVANDAQLDQPPGLPRRSTSGRGGLALFRADGLQGGVEQANDERGRHECLDERHGKPRGTQREWLRIERDQITKGEDHRRDAERQQER